MHFKKKILILFFLYSCVPIDKFPTDTKVLIEDSFSNDGFTLVLARFWRRSPAQRQQKNLRLPKTKTGKIQRFLLRENSN